MSNKKKKGNFKKMLSYYRPFKGMLIADLTFALLSSLVALAIPLVVRYVTNTLIYSNTEDVMRQLVIILVILVVLLAINFGSKYYIGNYGHMMGAKIEYNMRSEIFEHLQKLSFSFYDDAKVGQLMSRITTDLFDITELLHHGPENVVLSVLKILGALIILANINGYLAIAAFAIIPIMLYFTVKLNLKMRATFRVNRKRVAEINGQIEDNLSGIRVVKSFGNEDVECKKFKEGNDNFLEAKRENYKYMGLFQAGIVLFTNLIQICVIIVGVLLITKQMLSISDFVTFLLYIGVFTEPVKTFAEFTEQFQKGYTGFERFREIMEIEPDIADAKDAIDMPKVQGNIEFKDVSFAYNSNVSKVLNHISLDIKAGSYTALVGSSGAGKTTLCSLIPRFYEVGSGSISIDGNDIKKFTLKSLRDNIGIVQQDVYLFSGTVYENISYGKPGASREEIIEAAKNANAHEFIMSLPNGYDTDIGQRGVKLSGGQKQRISIARVFLKNPSILIFDEATSALDNESEFVVQESLERLAKGRTSLVIAHRLTTIKNAERILVLSEDGIEESGTHEELLEKGGIYSNLYSMYE